MFSKVYVPVDGSENSHRALNTSLFLSTKTEAQLTALNVMENPPTVYLKSPTTYFQSPKMSNGHVGQQQTGIKNNSRKVQRYR